MIWELDPIYRYDPGRLFFCIFKLLTCILLQDMLGAEQAYEGLYGQGPPSVHSSHGGGGRGFQQGL